MPIPSLAQLRRRIAKASATTPPGGNLYSVSDQPFGVREHPDYIAAEGAVRDAERANPVDVRKMQAARAHFTEVQARLCKEMVTEANYAKINPEFRQGIDIFNFCVMGSDEPDDDPNDEHRKAH